MSSNTAPVEIEVEVIFVSHKAILVNDGNVEEWIPISQIEEYEDCDELEKGDEIAITIPEWLALDKGLI